MLYFIHKKLESQEAKNLVRSHPDLAKISSQAVDVEAHLIPEGLPAFQRRGWPQSAKSRHFPAHSSGFRLL